MSTSLSKITKNNFELESNELSIGELLVGFDKEFASRIKRLWDDSQLTTHFQQDLNALNRRWSFSFAIENIKHSGANKVMGNIAWAVLIAAFGALLLFVSMKEPAHRKTPLAFMMGSVAVGMGCIFMPMFIYNKYVTDARNVHVKTCVEKNLSNRISKLDCKRLTQSLLWAWERGVAFNIYNENHLRGKYKHHKTWWGGTRYV